MRTVPVELPVTPYRIAIGDGLLQDASLLRSLIGARALLVTDGNVGPLYASRVATALGPLLAAVLELPAGESHKDLAAAQRIWDALATSGCGRDATVVALGGGVVGDLAGFAAACWHRGIGVVQLPTTLLAMVDAAVGGKTAVNHSAGKNLIGAFHQPRGVVSDIATLATLPARELRAGLAEAIKVALALDAELFERIERDLDAILALEPAALEPLIARCCELKASLVVADEREDGPRAVLNLGHTFGHAIEQALGYGSWLHGEAVAAGISIAARASRDEGSIDPVTCTRIEDLLTRAGLPTAPPVGLGRERLEPLLGRDKKARGGRPRFVLLRAIGRAEVVEALSERALARAFDA